MTSACVAHRTKAVHTTVTLPASKSISNRVLILEQLSPGSIILDNLSRADDTLIMREALRQTTGVINVKNAGTCMRFLAAFFAGRENCMIELHGDERMVKRPLKPLIDALIQLGADIAYLKEEGFPPLRINGKRLAGGKVTIDASLSSQYITALMLIAPSFSSGLTLELSGEISSRSYIMMTVRLMQQLGFTVSVQADMIYVAPLTARLPEVHYTVEPDWSAASYWYEIAALSKDANILLRNLQETSLQGDAVIATYMRMFGVCTTYTEEGAALSKYNSDVKAAGEEQIQLSSTPDLAPALAVTAAATHTPLTLTGLHNLPIKESDRLAALERELKAFGFCVEAGKDFLAIYPTPGMLNKNRHSAVSTYNDHRIAMAFAPLALLFDTVEIEAPDVVEKSYPQFWEDLSQAGFELTENVHLL
jgi:3-phosphoshikimate 1-carboxyvinyltransferase